jgi:hypothetical protein
VPVGSLSVVGAHLCATGRSGASTRCGRAQVRSYRRVRMFWGGPHTAGRYLLERTLCATNLGSGTPRRCGRAQVRSYKGSAHVVDGGSTLPTGHLWERTLCATNLRSEAPGCGNGS